MKNNWQTTPPDSEGFWWLYGDEEFGTMGGNYNGTFPPDTKLRCVEVIGIGKDNHLIGIANGRMFELRPFNLEKRKSGYVGVWQKVILPELPGTVG